MPCLRPAGLRPLLIAVAAVAAMAMPSARSAAAADLDYGFGQGQSFGSAPPPVAESKVEFGSGWYVRGDVGATRLPGLDLTDPNPSSDPNSTGQAPTIALTNGSKLGYTGSLGAGYAFNRWFRADATFDFHQSFTLRHGGQSFKARNVVDGNGFVYANAAGGCQIGEAAYAVGNTAIYMPYDENCSSNYQASLTSYDALVNGYLDLGHYSVFTPYVGAGLGLSFGHYAAATAFYNPDGTSYNTTFTLPQTGTQVHGYNDVRATGNYYNFAFAAMAGVAVDIYPHAKLDIGYRYLHLGEVLGANLTYQEAHVGVRYMIDN